jgi:hypothetical protein
LVASGLWLRAGFVAASVAAIALIMLATGEANPSIAIASTVAGGVAAAYAWGRSRAILNRADALEAAAATEAAPARPPAGGFGAPVESAASR